MIKDIFVNYIDWSQPSLLVAMASICFNPLFWNIAARQEYRTHIITRLAGGNARWGCYALAITIFSLGIFRDSLYHTAMQHQPTHPELDYVEVKVVAGILFLVGNTLVLSSMWALGLTGTYLGDYFGILMDAKVTGFPFNITDNPMYQGSTMSFLAAALWYGSPAGVVLTGLVHIVYTLALGFEEPFTSMIYSKRDTRRSAKTE
ncbi:phospholipid methyltransferase-domain-containing protein [Piptocephalis cylindrospora]|uniref:Phosphatidyl-N-methylethanolamine N-methyltransferase n=1 Tax=Piptocephalis cylindrospora TaxID=1907219 RepID=A0A4P9Y8H7_9FUNG|nr:phospholipid methyltransferase-domain-containing protein [Piptocephalis cylindrospora]|eukprot:RKP15383.1 phospholipid methyltransferase-domain-containing protein [Piptocephalis cylindrospora]